MSMPIIQQPENPIDRDQSVNDLIESVALMETGLSHIINAEGEKIQKVVDPDADYTIDDIVLVNNSVEKMVNTVAKLEMMLQSKLETTKEFDTGTQPGPTPITDGGSILAFSSAANLSTTATGAPNEGTLLNFGATTGPIISLNGNPEEFQLNYRPCIIPISRDGIITSISIFFDLIGTVSGDTQVIARLCMAQDGGTTFHPIDGTTILLSPIIPAGASSAHLDGSLTGLNINIAANSKIGFLIYCNSDRQDIIQGLAGATIAIQ